VCVWVRQIGQLRLTIPHTSDLSVTCALGAFLGGSQGGGGGGCMPPPGYAQCPESFFWAVFAIFSGFVN
jgi:hypothetical protein